MKQPGLALDPLVEIAQRPIPQEPLYIIVNLGISEGFGFVDVEHLTFPTVMKVDWVRVYQDPNAINIGCDPEDFPTMDYIKTYVFYFTDLPLSSHLFTLDTSEPILMPTSRLGRTTLANHSRRAHSLGSVNLTFTPAYPDIMLYLPTLAGVSWLNLPCYTA